MRHMIYLNKETEDTLNVIFEYLKSVGDIPANASAIGPYRAQVLTFCINLTLDGLHVISRTTVQNTGGQHDLG